jgi:hypothetical protein
LSFGAIFGFTFVTLFAENDKNTNGPLLQRKGGQFTTGKNGASLSPFLTLREMEWGFHWGRSLLSI